MAYEGWLAVGATSTKNNPPLGGYLKLSSTLRVGARHHTKQNKKKQKSGWKPETEDTKKTPREGNASKF